MKLLLSLIVLIASQPGICQKKDYLIKNQGDTIWGDITLKNKMFYVSGSSQTILKAADVSFISSVSYRGNIVFTGTLLTYTDNIADLELNYFKKGSVDTVLILSEEYITPKINLYYGTDDYKSPFYFYKTPSDPKPVQLVVRYYLDGGLTNYANNPSRYRGDKVRLHIVEQKGYINQLYAIMGGYKKIPQTMWDGLSYRNYSLKQVIKRYNKCD